MLHKLRGLYDTYHFFAAPGPPSRPTARRCRSCARSWPTNAGRAGRAGRVLRARGRAARRRRAAGRPVRVPRARSSASSCTGSTTSGSPRRRSTATARSPTRCAERAEHFPAGREVFVGHPPTQSARALHGGRGDYLFTASRLDDAKRVGLIVEAMAHVKRDVELRIAGTGPEASAPARAGGRRPRGSRFSAASRRASWSSSTRARAPSPFVPYLEDYGYVTLEAMLAGKPVITCSDSGGHDRARARRRQRAHRRSDAAGARRGDRPRCGATGARSKRMGAAGARDRPRRDVGRGASRSCWREPKLVVATSFGVHPPRGGGQARVAGLYGALARLGVEVEIVSLVDRTERGGRLDAGAGRARAARAAHAGARRRRLAAPPAGRRAGRRSRARAAPRAHAGLRRGARAARRATPPRSSPATPTRSRAARRRAAGAADLRGPGRRGRPEGRRCTRPRRTAPALAERVRELEARVLRRGRPRARVRRARRRAARTSSTGSRAERVVEVPNGADPDAIAVHAARRAPRARGARSASATSCSRCSSAPGTSRTWRSSATCSTVVDELARACACSICGSAGLAFADEPIPGNFDLCGVVDDGVPAQRARRRRRGAEPDALGLGHQPEDARLRARRACRSCRSAFGNRGLDFEPGRALPAGRAGRAARPCCARCAPRPTRRSTRASARPASTSRSASRGDAIAAALARASRLPVPARLRGGPALMHVAVVAAGNGIAEARVLARSLAAPPARTGRVTVLVLPGLRPELHHGDEPFERARARPTSSVGRCAGCCERAPRRRWRRCCGRCWSPHLLDARRRAVLLLPPDAERPRAAGRRSTRRWTSTTRVLVAAADRRAARRRRAPRRARPGRGGRDRRRARRRARRPRPAARSSTGGPTGRSRPPRRPPSPARRARLGASPLAPRRARLRRRSAGSRTPGYDVSLLEPARAAAGRRRALLTARAPLRLMRWAGFRPDRPWWLSEHAHAHARARRPGAHRARRRARRGAARRRAGSASTASPTRRRRAARTACATTRACSACTREAADAGEDFGDVFVPGGRRGVR